MNKYSYQPLEFPFEDKHRDLWKAYWIKDGLYHYQLRLPVHYAMTLEDYKDPINHYRLCDVMLTYNFAKLPIINSWFQLEMGSNHYTHWQAHVVTTTPIDTNLLRAVMYPEATYKVNLYCRVARDPWDSVNYCTKERTRVQGPWFYTASRRPIECERCKDIGCLDCSGMSLNAL